MEDRRSRLLKCKSKPNGLLLLSLIKISANEPIEIILCTNKDGVQAE